MEYRRLGRTGLKVSELCLGCLTFGRMTDAKEAKLIVDRCLDAGVVFFDTSNSYNAGASEEMLGKALGARRSEVVVASKFFAPIGPGPNDSGMSRTYIMKAIEGSLRRLGTDFIDLYYMHHVDEESELEEMLRALDDLVKQGKVRYAACSNFEAWRLATALGISEGKDLVKFACCQPQYSLVVRDIEEELFPLIEYSRIGVAVWGPLAGGFLAGNYQPGERRKAGTRSEDIGWGFPEEFFGASADRTLGTLLKVAKEIGKSPAQVAIRWVLDRPLITSAIVGARNAKQVDDCLGAVGWRLDPGPYQALELVSRPQFHYPRTMEEGSAERRATWIKIGQV